MTKYISTVEEILVKEYQNAEACIGLQDLIEVLDEQILVAEDIAKGNNAIDNIIEHTNGRYLDILHTIKADLNKVKPWEDTSEDIPWGEGELDEYIIEEHGALD